MIPQAFKELLEKYYEAQTTLDEERQMQRFLENYQGADQEINEAKMLFESFGKELKTTANISFDDIVNNKPVVKMPKLRYVITGVAAALLIALTLTFWLNQDEQPVVYAYINGKPITDKELALNGTKQALFAVSENLNKGTQGLEQLNKLNKPAELLTVKKTKN